MSAFRCFLMVLRDTPVRRSISRIAKPCRSRSLRITFSSPMSITPLAPSLFARGRVTWVKSQWKLRAHPGHFSLEINTCALPRIASVTWTSAPRIAAPRLGALNTVSINRASAQTLLNTVTDTPTYCVKGNSAPRCFKDYCLHSYTYISLKFVVSNSARPIVDCGFLRASSSATPLTGAYSSRKVRP